MMNQYTTDLGQNKESESLPIEVLFYRINLIMKRMTSWNKHLLFLFISYASNLFLRD
jgi:hypothetical protein